MILEDVLPSMRKGKSIKRTRKSHNQAQLVISFFYGKLCCKYLFKSGKSFVDKKYQFSNEDLLIDDWEIVDNWGEIVDDWDTVNDCEIEDDWEIVE